MLSALLGGSTGRFSVSINLSIYFRSLSYKLQAHNTYQSKAEQQNSNPNIHSVFCSG